MKCKKCKHIAVYDSPTYLCEKHWLDWWVDGMKPKTKKERLALIKEAKAVIHGKP